MTVTLYQRPLSAVLNIFSNMAGGIWIALLTLIITPIQVNILGIESYGLVGFIVTLQAICSALDFGLSTTLTRELAMNPSQGCHESQVLVQTVGTIYWCLAFVLGVILLLVAAPLSHAWFNPRELDPDVLVFGVRIISVYLALRWPVALYTSILSGLQRMDLLNLLKVMTTSFRLVGGIIVLLISRDLVAFLWWILVNALLEVLAYFFVCRKVYPMQRRRLSISWSILQPIWRYSLKMNMMAILTVMVVQADRLQVSRLLSMDALGYYSLAYGTVSSVSLILGAISSALLPSFSSSHCKETLDSLVSRYYRFCSMTLFIIGGIVFAFMFFGETILSIWVNPMAAAGAWRPLAWLAAAFWFSAACSNAYTIAVSCGQPGIPLNVSLLSAFPYLFALPIFINVFGVNGPAMAFLGLNMIYIVSLVPLVHRKVLKISSFNWFFRVFLLFSCLGVFSFGFFKLIVVFTIFPFNPASELLMLALAMIFYGMCGLILLGKEIRMMIGSLVYDKVRLIWGREFS